MSEQEPYIELRVASGSFVNEVEVESGEYYSDSRPSVCSVLTSGVVAVLILLAVLRLYQFPFVVRFHLRTDRLHALVHGPHLMTGSRRKRIECLRDYA